jgi:MarR family 2-MHQ and catechol resistance regulon transcriptional repressor
MNDPQIDLIIENLTAIMPLLHRKLLRMDLGGTTGELTRLHLGVMARLREGSMTASELAKTSVMPKPQVTHLVDQLVKNGVVERHPDSADRRVINIALTERGHLLFEDLKQKVQETIRKELAGLTPQELAEMSGALETLRRIGTRV